MKENQARGEEKEISDHFLDSADCDAIIKISVMAWSIVYWSRLQEQHNATVTFTVLYLTYLLIQTHTYRSEINWSFKLLNLVERSFSICNSLMYPNFNESLGVLFLFSFWSENKQIFFLFFHFPSLLPHSYTVPPG